MPIFLLKYGIPIPVRALNQAGIGPKATAGHGKPFTTSSDRSYLARFLSSPLLSWSEARKPQGLFLITLIRSLCRYVRSGNLAIRPMFVLLEAGCTGS